MSESVLTSIALLGTSRGGELPSCPDPSLEGPWAALDSSQVLPAAALEAAAFSTGLILNEGKALAPSALDEREPLPGMAADRLALMLSGQSPECLPEFLKYAVMGHFRAPYALVPSLLDYGIKSRDFRSRLATLAGTRGTWLAHQNPSWGWLSQPSELHDDSWETGATSERLEWLRQTRSSSPDKASAAIQATWKAEDPAFRLALVELARESSSLDDEPWLEQALGDPRGEVRFAATSVLLRLPSAFRTRSLERARRALSLKGRKLTLVPPSAFEPSWKPDGLREKPPAKLGERAWWLRQLLARVPLPDWPALLGIPREKFYSLKIDSDWVEAVQLAWIDSAKFHPAPDFVPFLIKRSPQAADELLAPLHVEQAYDILDTLPEDLVLPQLSRLASPPEKDHSCLKLILKHLLKGKVTSRPEAHRLAQCLPPTQIKSTLETISKQKSLDPMTEEFARTLEFRQSYLKPLTTSP